MIKINPVSIGYPAQEANAINVKFVTFEWDATTCITYYELFNISTVESPTGQKDEEGNDIMQTREISKKLTEGNYTLTEEEYDAWGADNTIAVDFVLNYLQLTRE